MPNLSFRGHFELSTCLQLQQRDQNHTAISHCCLTRSHVGTKDTALPTILGWNYSNVEQKLLSPRKTSYSIHQAVDIGVATGSQKCHCLPKIFEKYSHFVLWDAFFQTKQCYSANMKKIPPLNFFAPPPNFCGGYATGCR